MGRRAAERLGATRHLVAEPLDHERDPHGSVAPLALQLGDPSLEPHDLRPLPVPVALQLAQQVGQGGGDQAHHRAPRGRTRRRPPGPVAPTATGSASRRGGSGGRPAGALELGEQLVRVGGRGRPGLTRVAQYAPRRPSTTGIVRAMIVRSSQIDQVSM